MKVAFPVALLIFALATNTAIAKPKPSAGNKAVTPAQAATAPAEPTPPEAAPESASDDTTRRGSEFLYQAPGQTLVLTPSVSNAVGTYKFKSVSAYEKAASVNSSVSLDAEWGIADFMSLGANVGYGVGVVDYDCRPNTVCGDDTDRSRGLNDIDLDLNFRIPLGAAALRFGVDASLSPGKHKVETDDDSNNFSGGHTVEPYLGVEVPVAQRILVGGSVAYEAIHTKRKVHDDGLTVKDYEVKPGKSFSANVFYEHRITAMFNAGAAIQYVNTPAADIITAGTTTFTSTGSNLFGLMLYAPIHFTPRISLIPALQYVRVDYMSKSVSVEDSDIYGFHLAGRFTF